MSITMPPAEPYSVPGISSAGATTVYYEPDPITGCGVTRITRFPGSTSRPPTRRRSASAPATTAVVQQHHLIGPTQPIHVGLIKSANDPTPVSQSGSLSMYYHPMLNEWRPFPTDIEVSEEVGGRQRRIRRIGGRLIHKAKDLGRDRASWPIRKEDISLPVPGSKRSAFEPIAEALQSLL